MRAFALVLRVLILLAFLAVAAMFADMAYSYIFDGYGLHPAVAYPAAVAFGLLSWAANRLLQRVAAR